MSIPLLLGVLFLIGLAADLVGRSTFLPRVTLLLIGGVAAGPVGFGALPAPFIDQWFAPMTNIALALIGFLLGHQLSIPALRRRGRKVIGITLSKVFGAWLAVGAGLLAAGVDPVVAVLLAALAPATDPAATFDVVHERGARGEFVDTLLSVVSLDDVVGLLLFVVMIAVAGALTGQAAPGAAVGRALVELAGSAALGVALGVPMALLTGRIRPGETTLAEGLGFVLVCSGLAEWLELTPILSALVMGMTVASLARQGKRLFDVIEGVEWPFMILFFVLAGASLDVDTLMAAGILTAIYIGARSLGIYVGARTGCALAGTPRSVRRWLGIALLPQAGVAIGMALLAAQRFPETAAVVLTVVIASTVILETIGPIFTRFALRAAAARSACTPVL